MAPSKWLQSWRLMAINTADVIMSTLWWRSELTDMPQHNWVRLSATQFFPSSFLLSFCPFIFICLSFFRCFYLSLFSADAGLCKLSLHSQSNCINICRFYPESDHASFVYFFLVFIFISILLSSSVSPSLYLSLSFFCPTFSFSFLLCNLT
jgi:hypothetical protein